MGYKNIGWFTTGRDEAALQLLKEVYSKVEEGFIPLEVRYVFLSKDPDEGKWAKEIKRFCSEKNIELICLPASKFEADLKKENIELWRERYHDEILNLIPKDVDFGLLAGYMWIVSERFCKEIRLINLHPALPGGPKGAWEDVMWQLISARAYETGAMMHLVTPELDEGPAISYFRINLRTEEFGQLWRDAEKYLLKLHLSGVRDKFGNDFPLFKKIREEEVKREVPLIIFTLKYLAEGKIDLSALELPKDLSQEIESYLETLQK